MFFSNILLILIVLFFAIQLFLAIREGRQNKQKVCLISKKTGRVFELNSASVADFLSEEFVSDFSDTAKMIFARVSDSFARGKLSDVKNYLTDKVLPVFEQAISDREAQHQQAEFTLIGFKEVKIIEDTPERKVVSFTTEQINLLKDEGGHVIEGDPLYVATVTEDWTFTKKTEETWAVSAIESREGHFA